MNERATLPHRMLTCYDATFARILTDAEALDSILVGDSLGMVFAGEVTTTHVTLEDVSYHTRAVKRGIQQSHVVSKPTLIADMPLGTYDSPETALKNAQLLLQAGAEMVKVEGPVFEVVKKLREKNIRVCAHIGLTPQTIHDYKVQGKTEAEAKRLVEEAEDLERAGAEMIVLEMIPAKLAELITERLKILTIGIGAGPRCGGQVLVLYDLLGLNPDFNPKFLKKYSAGYEWVRHAVESYGAEVREGKFPAASNAFKQPEPTTSL